MLEGEGEAGLGIGVELGEYTYAQYARLNYYQSFCCWNISVLITHIKLNISVRLLKITEGFELIVMLCYGLSRSRTLKDEL
jgi:hypothetical protein